MSGTSALRCKTSAVPQILRCGTHRHSLQPTMRKNFISDFRNVFWVIFIPLLLTSKKKKKNTGYNKVKQGLLDIHRLEEKNQKNAV
jgi:hypothetical protein